jgi:peptidyl-prolyl cis-trans isomerase SurA
MNNMKKMKTLTDWQKLAWRSIAAAGLCACLVPAGIAAQAQQGTAPSAAPAQAAPQGESSSNPQAPSSAPSIMTSVPLPAATPAGGAPQDPSSSSDSKGTVIEEVVARVNDDIITRTDLDQARAQMVQETHEDCTGCTDDQLQAAIAQKEPDLLRDLIDQALLVQRAKDDDINVEADVVKKLDDIRQQNHLDSLEELEQKVDDSGVDFEDYKDHIRKELLTQQVVRQEVSSHVIIDHADVVKYYQDHQDEFQRPEQVSLREILVSTKDKTPDEIPALQKKAQGLLDRVRAGDDFAQLAIHFSDGPTAKDGGELGQPFQRGVLAKPIEDQVFKLDKNQTTEVIQTQEGFLILEVEQRYEAGLQPLDKVEDEIMDKLFEAKVDPAVRDFLKQLRQDSYVQVKPGYVDTAAVVSTEIQEVSAVPDASVKKQKMAHKFLIFGHKKYPSQGT